ncbi:hypothetical protein [Devosia submarina]|uniref:hypothetical protein n=1 Tax=Devosia submarina TaxID=1173082 RepID=UPI000D331DD4|nr:hypothetical protein [Devosia submarina]
MSIPSRAQEANPTPSYDSNVFFFGGVYSSESVGETFNFLGTDYQDAYLLGGGYQQFFLGEENGFRAGLEGGLALRKGPDVSGEAWAGVVLRSDGFVQNEHVKVSASVTGGLSLITNPLDVEVAREIARDGDSTFLFYMAPELSVSTKDNPDMEVFWRLQHRSGGWNTLGHMGEGANANTIGMRWKF